MLLSIIVRNMILRTLVFVALAFATSGFAKAERPSVLFIAIDDLRTDLGCYGNSVVKSPNLDRLAERSTLFERAYCQQAVCNPSRASLLTGLRLNTLGIWDLPTHFRQKRPDIVTLPQAFLKAGYHTQCIGKIFHNWRQDDFKGDAVSWSVPESMHYNSHGNDKAVVVGEVPPNESDCPKCVVRDVPDTAYFDGRIAEQAVSTLRRLKDKSFFLAVGFWKPHSHFNAPKKYWDLYQRDEIPPIANPQPPANVPSIAMHDSREILRSFRNRPDKRPTSEETTTLRHGYYANISYMDAQLGKVLNELRRLDLHHNTIVVVWSDHGFHLGEHHLWAKTSNFELDARVPLMICLPGQTQAQRASSLVELLDLYPTLLELCKLDPPHKLEGKSLLPILRDPKAIVKTAALTQHPRPAYPAKGANPDAMGYSVRTDRYRYTEWRDFKTNEVIATELYDHKTDAAETRNISDEANNVVLDELQAALASLLEE